MNRILKGSVAGAAGIVLMTGGYGTFALWSDAEALPGATIEAGELYIVDGADQGTWMYVDAAGETAGPFDPASDTLVPGDTVRLVQGLDVVAAGTSLEAVLTLTGLAEDFANLQVTLGYAGKEVTSAADGSGPLQLDFANADLDALNSATEAVVTFSFPSTVSGTTDQGASAALADATLVLAQAG
jgi:alternate signal-mediated exported protein